MTTGGDDGSGPRDHCGGPAGPGGPGEAGIPGGSPVKDEERYLEKAAEYAEAKPGRDFGRVLASICDGLRYTWVCPGDGYVPGVAEITGRLRARGYTLVRLRNFWASPDLKGISSVWRDKDGMLFEQQYHTPESMHARELTFPAAQRIRHLLTEPAERKATRDFQREVMAAVPVPPGALAIPGTGAPQIGQPAPYPGARAAEVVGHYAIYDLTDPGGLLPASAVPAGVLRRIVTADGERDHAFCRDNRTGEFAWKATSLLYSAERGDLAHEFAPVSEDEATRITARLRAAR